jgi:hypothetical protein
LIPIAQRFSCSPDAAALGRINVLAARLLRERPALARPAALQSLAVEHIDDAPALHLDDLTGIALIDRFWDVSYVEDRARLRAVDGDLVASCAPPVPDFERYCADRLGIGSVTWLHPNRGRDAKRVASACWTDVDVRRQLVARLRAGSYRYLHPHIGNRAIWALAVQLSEASGRSLRVIAPYPALAEAVNDKCWFADVAARLLGERYVPPTFCAWSPAGLAKALRLLGRGAERLVVKVPSAGGGAGSVVIDTRSVRSVEDARLKDALRAQLEPLCWRAGDPLLVARWETHIVEPVSCQVWIPPEAQGVPMVEGVFRQLVERDVFFVGAYPADIESAMMQAFAGQSCLLALLFQRLGYTGRCSFDAIVLDAGDGPRLQFLECNGRWGGASTPMTLMHRLFGGSTSLAYVTRRCRVHGLENLDFNALLEHFDTELYDAGSGRGRLIFYSPNGLRSASSIDVVALGTDGRDAAVGGLTRCLDRLTALAVAAPGRRIPR